MITKFIRKYALILALASALLFTVSAPYLIAENPDSSLFRSGTLGLLLILAAAFPAYQSLERADMRTLVCSFGFALLFAIALSLGSELYIYDGLLPGMSSMLRRLAVPCMAAPLLSLLFARLMLLTVKRKQANVPLYAFALVMFVCWLPLLFTYFPAALNYDFPGQVGQYVNGPYSNTQPMLHTIFAAAFFALGEALFASRTVGLLLITIVQMVLFALSLAYACTFAQRRGTPFWALGVMTAYFALHPLFSVMAISTTKDTLFASAILILSLQSYEIIDEGTAFFNSKLRTALYISMAVCIVLLRSNGVVSLMLTLPALFIVCRSLRRKVAMLGALCAAAIVLSSAAIDIAFKPVDMSIHQSLSLPAQQLVRAYNKGALTNEERAEIRSWYTSDFGVVLHPYLADGAKGYLDDPQLEANMGGYISLWAKTLAKCPREYAEAFLMLNIGSWYPDDISHANIYRDASYVDKGYLQTIEYDMADYGIHTRAFLPRIQAFYESICRENTYLKYPVISHLFNTALPFWALLFCAAFLMASGRSRYLPSLLCAIGLWGTYLFFGPCTLARYVLPLFVCAPPMLCSTFFARD